MAVILIVEEDGDSVVIRKIPRVGREHLEPAMILAKADGDQITGARLEENALAKMITIHLLLGQRPLVTPANGLDLGGAQPG